MLSADGCIEKDQQCVNQPLRINLLWRSLWILTKLQDWMIDWSMCKSNIADMWKIWSWAWTSPESWLKCTFGNMRVEQQANMLYNCNRWNIFCGVMWWRCQNRRYLWRQSPFIFDSWQASCKKQNSPSITLTWAPLPRSTTAKGV